MHKDCFGYNDGCNILLAGRCEKRCSFYKTKERLKVEQQKAFDRLLGLGRIDLIEQYKVKSHAR